MKPLKSFSAGWRLGAALAALVAFGSARATAQTPADAGTAPDITIMSGTNAPSQPSGARIIRAPRSSGPAAASMTLEVPPAGVDEKAGGTNDDIQLSFQGADVNMVVQWLMQTTGKSVLKNQQVNTQITVSSAKKIPKRQALELVYKALAMEGYSVTETATYIAITREGQEPKTSPELVGSVPDGRQRLVKFFPLQHAQASDLRDRVRIVLSDKATVDVDDRGNQLIVTDYNENLRLLTELMKELDVTTTSDFTLQIYPLKYGEAEEVGNLISMILNAQSPPPPSPRPPGGGSSSRPPPGASAMSMVIGGPSMDMGSSSSPSPSGGSSGSSAQAASQQVRIWADKTANRLIVSAPKSKLPEVERLITVLDTTKPEDVAVRVLPLKHVMATDVVKEITPLYQKLSGRSIKEIIEVQADDQSNSLIILSSESNFRAIEKLINTLDTEDAQDKIMKTFSLKNADATDVAKQLQDLNADPSSGGRYNLIILNPYGNSGGGKSKKMTVVADRRRNAVIVQAPPAQMEGVEKMIDELDAPVAEESLAPQIYPLKYVSAADIEDVLNELFLKKSQQRNYWDPYSDEYTSTRTDQDAGPLYGKVRITSELHANAIIVTANSKDYLAAVENVLKQLDVPTQGGETTFRIVLRHAKADVMAKYMNILFAKNGSPGVNGPGQQQRPGGNNNVQQQQQQQQDAAVPSAFDLAEENREEGYFPWLNGQPDSVRSGDRAKPPINDLIDRIRVVPDHRGNALLVSANLHLFPQISKIVEQMDSETDQVMIEARIVEVSTDYLDKLGVRWAPSGSGIFSQEDLDNAFLAHVNNEYQKGYGGNTRVNTPPLSGASLAQILTSLRSGMVNSTISIDFLVQFLRRTTDATVLGEPQITISDNETGKLFVGQQVPFITRSQSTDVGSLNQSFDYKRVGVILEVTPHINTAGDVELKIHAESSAVVPGQTLFGGAILDTRQFRTELTLRDGQTRILGGIIQRQVSDTLRKTPILGSIPGLGWIFNKKDKTTREVELMVFLRPKIVHGSADAEALVEEIYKKAPLLKQEEESRPPEKKKK